MSTKKTKKQIEEKLEEAHMEAYSVAEKHRMYVEELEEKHAEEVHRLQRVIDKACLPHLLLVGDPSKMPTAVCPICKATAYPAKVLYDDEGEPFIVTMRPISHKADCYFMTETAEKRV